MYIKMVDPKRAVLWETSSAKVETGKVTIYKWPDAEDSDDWWKERLYQPQAVTVLPFACKSRPTGHKEEVFQQAACGSVCVDYTNGPYWVIKFAAFHADNGEWTVVATTDDLYIMNDDGNTIDRIK